MALIISNHARERLDLRGLTVADVNWAIAGGNFFNQGNGNRHYSRSYDAGRSSVHVITSGDGQTLVSAWIRGRDDVGL